MRLNYKIAVITGSTQGIGRGIAKRFAAEGASVVIVGRSEDKGKAVKKEIRELGGNAEYVKADVSIDEDVKRMVNFAIEKYGQIDILVNNAGINLTRGIPFFEISMDQWQQTIDVNLTGVFLCSRAAVRHMIERREGKIINIASVHSFATSSGNAAYAASKGGIIQLTKAMAIDLAPYNIAVNAIAPGAIAIERMPEDPDDPMNDFILQKRWGKVEEIAALAVFLASEESSYINGETIIADGGLMTLLPGKPIGTP